MDKKEEREKKTLFAEEEDNILDNVGVGRR